MNSDNIIYNSFWGRIALLISVSFSIFFIFFNHAYAWDKAIWPFNTPTMVSKQICKNAKYWAITAYNSYDSQARADLMSELNDQKSFSIREEPKYKAWHIIYYKEMVRYVMLVWRNPNITEDMAIEIVKNDCNARRQEIQEALDATDPEK